MMSHTWRAALRRLSGARGSSMAMAATLALALGANSAVFSLADALLFRPLPFADPARLVVVSASFPRMRLTGMGLSGPEALELGALTHAFDTAGPLTFDAVTIQAPADTLQASVVEAAVPLIRSLGIVPIAGRLLLDEEDRPGAPLVAMLGEGIWARAFGSDPAIVGRMLRVAGRPTLIVGVVAQRVSILNRTPDIWLPLRLTAGSRTPRADHRFTVIARIKAGLTFADATADVAAAVAAWQQETGEFHAPAPGIHPLEIRPLADVTRGTRRDAAWALAAAVTFVLLLTCANVANLLVARAERRRAQLGIQIALGATRGRLLREHLLDGLILAFGGAAGGLALAHFAIRGVQAIDPTIAQPGDLGIDWRVLGFTAAAATVTGLVVGAAPVARLDVQRAFHWLQSASRGSGSASGRGRVQRSLIALQIALAVLLSGSAGIMVRSLLALTSVEAGFDPHGVLRAEISLPEASYQKDEEVWSLYDRILERAAALPGVTSAALMSGLPPLRRANNTTFMLDGAEMIDHDHVPQVDYIQHITPGYLDALRIPLVLGRNVTAADDERSPPVVLVNETLARRFWPGDRPLGHRLRPAIAGAPWFTVIGVTRDTRQGGLNAPAGGEVLVPYRQSRRLLPGWMPRDMNLALRVGRGAPATIAPSLREAIAGLERAAAVSGVAPLDDLVEGTVSQPRLLAWVLSSFAIVALVIAGVGVYGVTAHHVGARTAEFGLRMALGAAPVDILRQVMTSGAPPVAAGLAAGILASLGCARFLAGLVFGVQPADPVALAAGVAAIAATAVAAAVLPALRAARLDPLTALRDS